MNSRGNTWGSAICYLPHKVTIGLILTKLSMKCRKLLFIIQAVHNLSCCHVGTEVCEGEILLKSSQVWIVGVGKFVCGI